MKTSAKKKDLRPALRDINPGPEKVMELIAQAIRDGKTIIVTHEGGRQEHKSTHTKTAKKPHVAYY